MPVLDEREELVEGWNAVVVRRSVDVPVRLITHRFGQRKLQARAWDINCCAMGIFVGFDLDLQEQITIELTTPECRPIQVRAVVRQRSGYRYAVEFLSVTEEDRANLAHLQNALSEFAWYWAGTGSW